MPYIDPTGVKLGFSELEEPNMGFTKFVEQLPTMPVPVPQVVSRYQARAALLGAGYLDQVNAFFAAMPDTSLEKMAWNEAPTVQRNSTALIAGATLLGLTSDQLDQLFITAFSIQ